MTNWPRLSEITQTKATLPASPPFLFPRNNLSGKKKILLKTSERPTHATPHLPPTPGATKAKHFALQLLQKISSQCS